MSSLASVSAHSAPGNSLGESTSGVAPSSGKNSSDLHDLHEENQSCGDENLKDNESKKSVTEGFPEHGDNEQSETEENTDDHNVSNMKVDSEEIPEFVDVETVSEENYEESEVLGDHNASNMKVDREEISECVEGEEVFEETCEDGEVMKAALEEHSQREEYYENISEEPTAEEKVVKERANNKLTTITKVVTDNEELAKGSAFLDYESFVAAVNRYSEVHGVTYVTAFSKTVSARNKECLKLFDERLRFINLRLRCKYGGTPRASTAQIRKHTPSTYKTNCPSTLTVSAQRDPDRLVVTFFNEEHNHEMVPVTLRKAQEKRASEAENNLRPKRRTKRSRPSTPPQETSKELTRALSNNLTPSIQTRSRGATPRSPMVKIRTFGSLTPTMNSLPPFRLPTPSAEARRTPGILRSKKVIPTSTPKQGAKPAKNQNVNGEHPYADLSPGPPFNKEEVVDITEDDDLAETDQSKEVGRVNDAWKCVYRVLENDHQQLRAEVNRLRKENQRLRANKCSKCGEKRV